MGNYMETCIQKAEPTHEDIPQHPQQKQEKEGQEEKSQESETTGDTFSKESSCPMRVKLVLTKDELQWLLLQLKKDQGGKLEEMLKEIEKSRLAGKYVSKWKPCLDSIMESPEVHHHMDRSL